MKRLWLPLALLCVVIIGVACVESILGAVRSDFVMFWRHSELAYPPPYLLFVEPISPFEYGVAFTIWVVVTGAAYVFASHAPKSVALANPAAAYNGMVGQNGFLVSAIMFWGLRELARNPFRGGAILGLLIIKPHIAAMIPIAVLAGRLWRAIPAALAVMAALCLAALLIFGIEAYARWLEFSTLYSRLLGEGAWSWSELASFYAFAKWFGAGDPVAWSLHAAFALAAAFAVWEAWRNDLDGKLPVTAAASLLASPYLFTYDAVLLTPALAFIRGPRAFIVWMLVALPLVRTIGPYDWPNTTPVAAALSVYLILAQERMGSLARFGSTAAQMKPAA